MSALAPVDPARPDFDLAPEAARDGAEEAPAQSASGGSSATYHGTDETSQNSRSNTGNSIQKQGIWRAWLLAGATRWGKGGGAVNKRLDLAKARAQACQVKTNRQVSINRSGGLLGRNSAGSGGAGASGGKSLGNKGGSNGAAKGPKNSNGSAHGSAGHGSAGRSGGGGGSGSGGNGGGRGPRGGGAPSGHGGGHSPKAPKGDGGGRGPKLSKGDNPKGGTSGGGAGGKNGTSGDSGSGGSGSGKGHAGGSADEKAKGPKSKDSSSDKGPEKDAKGSKGAAGAAGASGKDGSAGKNGSSNGSNKSAGTGKSVGKDTRTPLEKTRETGHGNGSAARRAVDHVKAYVDGARDGWGDERDKNAKEHDRLDKAHAQYKAKLQGTSQGQTVQIEDDTEPMEDPFMRQATPIQAQGIDANKLTFGEGFVKPSVTRGELRTFKQYEGRLESRIDSLAKIAEATKTLADQAREQAKDCQQLAEDAKGVKGGDKLVGELQKLADQAKTQAGEADEVHKRAARAHDFAKGVLSNIQTRYAPLYQAVVDSDEVKPAELKFYEDRGVTRSDAALAA
ncbi:hypothetical protein [Streptomyces asiaticus]|uniref:hypothetical protein n=1 Tax=Streptomyces asiaticus TaxID=114695 RepID=UPI00382B9DD1